MAALGVVGYGVALVFLLFGGPDLALTQFAIETLSVLLFVLVLRRLPRLRTLSPRVRAPSRRCWWPSPAGVFVTALVLAATAAPHPAPLRDYFARGEPRPRPTAATSSTSSSSTSGRFDTLGEITVLAVAALGVCGTRCACASSAPGRGEGR